MRHFCSSTPEQRCNAVTAGPFPFSFPKLYFFNLPFVPFLYCKNITRKDSRKSAFDEKSLFSLLDDEKERWMKLVSPVCQLSVCVWQQDSIEKKKRVEWPIWLQWLVWHKVEWDLWNTISPKEPGRRSDSVLTNQNVIPCQEVDPKHDRLFVGTKRNGKETSSLFLLKYYF